MNSPRAAGAKHPAANKSAHSSKQISRPALAQTNQGRLRTYGIVLLAAACMVLLIFIIRQIYPFGDRVLRFAGGDGEQYFGILGYLQNTLFTSNDLLYSWSTVLGGNMIGIYAFNASSPFNLLTALFPDNLMAAYHLIFALKYVCAALSFAVMLENVFAKPDIKAAVLFSISYPFMAYMTYYGWNQSWMDGVVLLPLVFLGIWQIVNQQKWLLYTIALALTLLSNYYIGYMICLASVLFLAAICFVVYKRTGKQPLLRAVGVYVLASLAAAGLVAVLLIPTYAALPESRSKSISEILQDVSYTSKPAEISSMLFTAPYGDMQYEDNYPVIYTGIVQLVLGVLFFLNKDIPKRIRVAAGVLLMVFAVSFGISFVNIAWHGFTKNVWFNFRYSFLLSFVIELIAFISFTGLRGGSREFGLAAVVLAGITILSLNTTIENIRPETLFWDIVWMAAALWLLYVWEHPKPGSPALSRAVCFGLIAALTLGNLLQNAYLTLDDLGELEAFTEAQRIDGQVGQIIDDDGFFRRASTWSYGRNDPMRLGYAGVENFASAENPEAVEAAKSLGIRSSGWRSYYGHNVPMSTDALLGIRYVTARNDSFKTNYYEPLDQIDDTNLIVLKNPYALPVIFAGERLSASTHGLTNPFEYLNSYWDSLSAAAGDVFTPVTFDMEKTGSDINIAFTATQDGPVYAFVPEGDITLDLSPTNNWENTFYVGTFQADETGELHIKLDGSYEKEDEIVLYAENPAALAEKAEAVLAHDISIDKKSSSSLTVRYEADEEGFLTSTIPYDEGWHVYVDGAEVDTYRNMDTFLSFDVDAGQHEIELRYWPPYLTLGIVVTVATGASILLTVLLAHRRNSKRSGAASQRVRSAKQ